MTLTQFVDGQTLFPSRSALGIDLLSPQDPFEAKSPEETVARLSKLPCRFAALQINQSCNLHCTHCYYASKTHRRREMSVLQWTQVLRKLAEEGIRCFHISGKEPLLSPVKDGVLTELNQLRREYGVSVGLVTNGTLLDEDFLTRYRETIDYIFVSIDGSPEIHDRLRGEGSFAKATQGIQLCCKILGAHKTINSAVVMRSNVHEIERLVEALADLGVRKFRFQHFVNGTNKSIDRNVEAETNAAALKTLMQWCTTQVAAFDIAWSIPPELTPLIATKSRHVLAAVEQAHRGMVPVCHVGSCTFGFMFHMVCLAFWNQITVLTDGSVAGCDVCHMLDSQDAFIAGNLLDSTLSAIRTKAFETTGIVGAIWRILRQRRIRADGFPVICDEGCPVLTSLYLGEKAI